ncbi:hypothetical protein ABS71_10680 [bacterium SCN 62-11]|nr:hypothetical protein [Candidatus Eremiobacteraeota bacterium]ODT67556.1 MAG: hypothetical protein ABS71_10680 [bacterium SCN 62-11]
MAACSDTSSRQVVCAWCGAGPDRHVWHYMADGSQSRRCKACGALEGKKPGHLFGEHWNDEVEARFAHKLELRRVLLEHTGKTQMEQHGGREWDPPALWCPGCHEHLSPAMGPRTCPNVMAEVNDCLRAGCTEAEVAMVWRQAMADLEKLWEEEMHRCHQ